MARTILVTGGSGFIGSYVLRRLAERGDTVLNFDLREPGARAAWWLKPVANRIRFVEGSIEDWRDLVTVVKAHQPEAIIHAAAIMNPPLLVRRPSLGMTVHIVGTYNVLEAARLFGV